MSVTIPMFVGFGWSIALFFILMGVICAKWIIGIIF